MGIHGFSKVFKSKEIKLKSLKGETGIIDASVMLYQACLGIGKIKALTDGEGNPTIHIKVIIGRILNFHANGITQKWVFDYHEKGYHSPDKEIELAKRRKKKLEADKKLAELQKKKEKEDELFSDTDEETEQIDKSIAQQEKIAFTMNERVVNDCKFILNCFGIQWTVAPKGFEAEHVASEMTKSRPIQGDFVYSTDVDTLVYGTTKLVRNVKIKTKKVLQVFELHNMLKDNKLTQDDLRTIGVIMGCDHCNKTRGIGPKTILKKFKDVELTDEQKAAKEVFKRTVDVSKIKFNNAREEPISDAAKMNKLLDWLEAKNFNRVLTKKQIEKVYKDGGLH